MKVYIGPYTRWIGPYQIAEALCFWAKEVEDEYGCKSKPDWVHKFGDWLAHGTTDENITDSKDAPKTWLYKLCNWIESKKKRRIYVKIDNYDVWSMDHTLANIIHPMLIKLQAVKHGAPNVDDEDVPDELKSTTAPAKKNEWDTDGNHFKRWDWVINEMIFAFKCKLDDSWEEEFREGEIDLVWVPVDKDGNEVPKAEAKLYQMTHGPNDTYKCDYEGMAVVQKRIDNGFRLFGKYFQALWD